MADRATPFTQEAIEELNREFDACALTGLHVKVAATPAPVLVSGSTACVDTFVDGWLLFIVQRDARDPRCDVYLLHESGNRVPPGPNLHAEWVREGERLIEALNRPLSEGESEVSRG